MLFQRQVTYIRRTGLSTVRLNISLNKQNRKNISLVFLLNYVKEFQYRNNLFPLIKVMMKARSVCSVFYHLVVLRHSSDNNSTKKYGEKLHKTNIIRMVRIHLLQFFTQLNKQKSDKNFPAIHLPGQQ